MADGGSDGLPPLLGPHWTQFGHLCPHSNQFCPSRTIRWCSKSLRARFFRFFVDFDAPRTIKIMEETIGKPRFFNGFHTFSQIAAKSKNKALEHAGTQKMKARAASNGSPSYQNASRKLQYETQERQDGLSECPNGCAKGSWQPNLLLQVFPKANLSSPRNLRDGFGRSQDSYLGGSSIYFEQMISDQ